MRKRTLRLKHDFKLSRANYSAWAADVAASVLPFFTRNANQTPLLALGKSVGKKPRRALIRAFRKQRERFTITNSIPRAGRCVAADLKEVQSSCAVCGQPAKELVSRTAFFIDGATVEFEGAARKTLTPCPACNSVSEWPVQGPATHNLARKSGERDALFSGIEEL